MKKFLLLLILTIQIASEAAGQLPHSMTFEWMGKKEGMPGLEILDLKTDKQGIIWMATNDGLYRWNGLDLDKFVNEKNNKNSISGNYVFEIDELKDGRLYCSTNKGISILNTETKRWLNIHIPLNNEANFANHSLQINDSTIVTLFGYYGIIFLDIKHLKFKLIKTKDIDITLNYLQQTKVDNKNNLWVTCTGGLLKINLATLKTKVYKPLETTGKSKFDNLLIDVYFDSNQPNKLYCSSWGGGIKIFNIAEETFSSYYPEDTNLPQNVNNIVRKFYRYKNEGLVVSTSGGIKLFKFQTNTFEDLTLKRSEGNNIFTINGILFNPDSSIIVYNEEGFGKTIKQHFEFQLHKFESNIHLMYWNQQSTSDNLEGVSIYNNRTYVRKNLNTNTIIDSIPLPLLDKNYSETNGIFNTRGGKMICTSNGIFYLNIKSREHKQFSMYYPNAKGDEMNKFYQAIGLTDSTFLFINITGDLYKAGIAFKNNIPDKIINIEPILKGRLIQSSSVINDSIIYLAADNLYSYNSKSNQLTALINLYDQKNRERVTSFYTINADTFWIGFDQNGCKKYFKKDGKFYYYHIAPDKDHPTTYFEFTSDHENGIWAITYDGLVRIASNFKITYYNKRKELLNVIYSEDIQELSDHRVWINNYFGPIEVIANKDGNAPPQLNIEIREIRSGGTLLAINRNKDKVELLPGQSDLSFILSAIQTDFASKINYKFRLINHDENWQDLGHNRYVNISNLEPGNYRLEVVAYDPENIMKLASKIINITVHPEFFQRKEVQIISTILLLVLLVIIIKYLATKRLTLELAALQTQNELDQMRNTISRDIHDELGANITRITLATELLKRQDKNSNEFIEQLKKLGLLSKNLGKSLGEIVWSVNPQQNKSEYLILFIKQYLNEINEDVETEIQFTAIETGKNITITPKAQRNLFLVIKEAVNNAIKYSQATTIKVTLNLNTETRIISINIEDNGNGFDLNQLRPYSNGITNMKTRCSELNLRFNIDSELNKGTKVTIIGDINKIEQSFY